jgi:hypothetical protein
LSGANTVESPPAVVKPFMLHSKQGAAVSLYLATSPEVAQVLGDFVKSKPAK